MHIRFTTTTCFAVSQVGKFACDDIQTTETCLNLQFKTMRLDLLPVAPEVWDMPPEVREQKYADEPNSRRYLAAAFAKDQVPEYQQFDHQMFHRVMCQQNYRKICQFHGHGICWKQCTDVRLPCYRRIYFQELFPLYAVDNAHSYCCICTV